MINCLELCTFRSLATLVRINFVIKVELFAVSLNTSLFFRRSQRDLQSYFVAPGIDSMLPSISSSEN